MSNEVIQETTPLVECSAFHRGMSVLEASLRNTEDSDATPRHQDFRCNRSRLPFHLFNIRPLFATVMLSPSQTAKGKFIAEIMRVLIAEIRSVLEPMVTLMRKRVVCPSRIDNI